MKKIMIASSVLALSMLVGCSDNEQQNEVQREESTTNVGQSKQSEEVKVATKMTAESIQPLLEAVKTNSFSSQEHAGTITLEERQMHGDEQIDYMKSDITYRQNDSLEGMYGENQLYYKKHLLFADGQPETYEVYIQPDKALYTFNDSAGWEGYALMEQGEMGLERVSFLSPTDVLSMLEMNESTVQVVDEKNDEVVISFEPLPEAQMELLYNVLEPESFYHITDMALEFEVFSIELVLSKAMESLRDISIDFKQVNIEDETEYLELHYHQYYTANKLEEEIRPPAAVFSNSGLTIWD